MYVLIFPFMNLVLFYFDVSSLGILLIEYLRYHGFHILTNLHDTENEPRVAGIRR